MQDSSLGRSSPLVPPLYQSSVYTLPDLDVLDRIMTGEAPGFIYARDGHPNARLLADKLAEIEGAAWAVVCASGMGAITAALLATARQGDHIVASNRLYGKTTVLLDQELSSFGVKTTFVDVSDLNQVRTALEKPSKLLLVETISNPLLRVSDLIALADLAHDHDCLLAVDNTFATPVLCRPIEAGADIVVESLTKMIGGHSDVTLGLVCGTGELAPQLRTRSIAGWRRAAWRRLHFACGRRRQTRPRWPIGCRSNPASPASSIPEDRIIPITTWPAICCETDSVVCSALS
jgi:cystathionine beta-lyase/cystathionine gamma-synthase